MKLDCSDPIWVSEQNGDPAKHRDASWPWSPYRLSDGRVYTVFHNEYHGHAHGNCTSASAFDGCWYPALTAGISDDGVHLQLFGGDASVVARSGQAYVRDATNQGYSDPTNVTLNPKDGRYYMISLRPKDAAPHTQGVCLLRTDRLDDAASWRVWNGQDFSAKPRDGADCKHLFTPFETAPGSLNYSTYLGRFVYLSFGFRERDGAQGYFLRYALNDELTSWSEPVLVLRAPNPWGENPSKAGRPTHPYPSFLDPAGGDNFDQLTQEPWLYFVRTYGGGQPTYRDVVRIKVRFVVDQPERDNRPALLYRVGGGGYYSNGYGANGGAYYCGIGSMEQLRACGWTYDFANLPEYPDHGANKEQSDPTSK